MTIREMLIKKGIIKEPQTNAVFASDETHFAVCCEIAEIEPSKRQAGKWRRKTGAAYRAKLVIGV